jgi:HK97 gp10 family phage protein
MTRQVVTYRMGGLRETQAALAELPKATAKNVGRRILRLAAAPILAAYQALAPRATGRLVETSGVGTKLSRAQKAKHKADPDRDAVEMHVGAGPNPQAVQQEFGNENHPAQPAMIPAWEGNKLKALNIIAENLWGEISKAATRLARKARRAGR